MRVLRGMALAVLAAAAVAAAPSPASARGPVEVGAGGIAVVRDEVLSDDGRLHELTLASDVLGRQTRLRLLLPAGYDEPANGGTRYPMLLLLHGAGSSERTWTENTDIEGQTSGLGLIVVMPEGGNVGFYSDWLDGPAWETFHLHELLPWVDATYRTVGTRAGRAVAGLSMGGFGSASYASRHPDVFVAMAAFSGAVDIAGGGVVEEAALRALGYADDRRWGPYLTHEANWRGHNPPDLAPNLRGMAVQLTTGTGVPCDGDSGVDRTEAGVSILTNSFALALQRAGVPYDLVLHACGTHQWHYWERDLAAWLPKAMALFAEPPAPPAAFAFRTTAAHDEVWGWSFSAHRPATEFLDLQEVSPVGLRGDRQRPGRRRDAAALRARRDVLDRHRAGRGGERPRRRPPAARHAPAGQPDQRPRGGRGRRPAPLHVRPRARAHRRPVLTRGDRGRGPRRGVLLPHGHRVDHPGGAGPDPGRRPRRSAWAGCGRRHPGHGPVRPELGAGGGAGGRGDGVAPPRPTDRLTYASPL